MRKLRLPCNSQKAGSADIQSSDFEEWTQSDQVFSAIFEHCAKNADHCTLSRRGNSAAELEKSYWSLYESLRYDPVPAGTVVLDHYALSQIASGALYSAYSWPNFTAGIDMLLGPKKDYDMAFLAAWTAQLQITDDTLARASQRPIQALAGIHCSDRVNRLSSLEAYMPVQQRLGNISRVMGPAEAPVAMTCAQWQIDAKERYQGSFQVAPRKPVLLVGNSYDGHTPIVSARNVSSGFEGSIVLEVNGYGVSWKKNCFASLLFLTSFLTCLFFSMPLLDSPPNALFKSMLPIGSTAPFPSQIPCVRLNSSPGITTLPGLQWPRKLAGRCLRASPVTPAAPRPSCRA